MRCFACRCERLVVPNADVAWQLEHVMFVALVHVNDGVESVPPSGVAFEWQ